jgi:PLP dependent protein
MKRKLHDNLKRVEQRIAEACRRVRRDPSTVKLIAVTKYASMDIIRALLELGVRDLGENRVQELTRRAAMIDEWRSGHRESMVPVPRWHLIGHLQRNKVKAVLPWIEMIHSVDSLRLAEEIDAQAGKLGRPVPILLEVNAAEDPNKYGVAVAAATHLVEQINTLKHIELRGLMAMAPLTDDVARIRSVFERVRELYDEVVSEKLCGRHFTELSMGMTGDFEQAIEFGATYVRIGSALLEGIELGPQPAEVDDEVASGI